jgi:hypothetical protein
MKLKKTVFKMTVAGIAGFYGVANSMLWYKKRGFTYFESSSLYKLNIFLFDFTHPSQDC